MKEKDQQIIQYLQEQDKKAIELLYDKYSASLYGVILKIVRSEELAQDVLQEAFIKAWKYGPSYEKKKGTLFTWLLNIARNHAIDKTRSANFRRADKIQTLDDIVYNSINLSESYNPDHIGLKSLVDGLDEKYRKIIDLIYFQGYTQKEIEAQLKIPLGTVKSRARIALRELRKHFEQHYVTILFWLVLVLI